MDEITKMLIAVLKTKYIVLFIVIFGTLSFPVGSICSTVYKIDCRVSGASSK